MTYTFYVDEDGTIWVSTGGDKTLIKVVIEANSMEEAILKLNEQA